MKQYFWNILISFDQFINVIGAPWWNLFVHKDGAKFGDPDETLSSVFGENLRTGTCKVCRFICKYILNPIDNKHCDKSIEEDEGNR